MTEGTTAAALAFDLGASSGRALIGELLDTDGRRALRVTEIHRFPNGAVQIGRHLHWDVLRLFEEIKQGIRHAFRSGYAPTTLGIDTWGVDFGLLDANGELLGDPYHYRDPQTDGLIEEVAGIVGGREELFRHGGLQLMPFNTIYQLYAMRKARSPKLDAARTLLLTPDLLAYWLTGVKTCEFTMATTTQLLHPKTRQWNDELMQRLGIPRELFLDPIRPGTTIGPLAPAVCEELGVPAISVVAVGTHDTESAVAAVPAQETEFAYLVCGTWSLIGTELAEPSLTPETMEAEFSNEGGVGDTYQLLKNIMGLWILQECKREWDGDGPEMPYERLIAEAEAARPLRSLIDPDDARFYAPGGMNEKVRSYCAETGQPVPQAAGEIARCVLESLALRYRQALEQAERVTGRTFGALHMVGGGIRNRLLCRMTAAAIRRPVLAGPVEASAVGNMLLQLISGGQVRDLAEARSLVAASFPVERYEPSAESGWDEAYRLFKNLRHDRD